MASPLKRTTPSRGGVSPMMERMMVVLPMPLRPSMATHVPCGHFQGDIPEHVAVASSRC